jgi:hypothetical protein
MADLIIDIVFIIRESATGLEDGIERKKEESGRQTHG